MSDPPTHDPIATTPQDRGESADAATAAMQMHERLSPQWVQLERIRGFAFVAVLGIAAMIVFVGLAIAYGPPATWWWSGLAASGLLLAGLAALAFLWPAWEYRYASFSLDERRLEIRRGVLWRVVTTIPRGRVQHTDVTQGPLERSFDVARLIVHTAGTQHATVTLDGLEHARAVALRDSLIAESDEDADVG